MNDIFDQCYDRTKPVDLITFVTHPYAKGNGKIDPVSKIYQTFQSTKTSPAIGIFYFFTIMSHWNLLKGATYKLPRNWRTYHPNLWVMALAHSGSSKSYQLSLLNNLLPYKELKNTFNQPASPVSTIKQFAKSPIHFWVEDEAAKYLQHIELPTHPLAPVKAQLLKIKGGDPLTYNSSTLGSIVVESPQLSICFISTVLGMVKAISDESIYDGFLSRFGIVLSETTDQMQQDIIKNFPDRYQAVEYIDDSGLGKDLEDIFNQDIENKTYTYSKDVLLVFEKASKNMEQSFMWMQGERNPYKAIFDRAMMESFKYALFHHQMMRKEGFVIDDFDMEYGMLIVRYHLCSFARYIQLKDEISRKGCKKEVKTRKRVAKKEEKLKDRLKSYLLKTPKASLRDVYRALHCTKSKAQTVLSELGITL